MSDDTEVMALSGLRRLVTHARDGLKATEIEPPAQFGYGKEWSPAQIRRYAAHTLAEQVLTLVLDCLPGGDAISVDEVAEIREGHTREISQITADLAEVRDLAEKRKMELDRVAAERDDAINYQDEAEASESAYREVWEEARKLAETDAPAAIKRILAGPFAAEPVELPVTVESP